MVDKFDEVYYTKLNQIITNINIPNELWDIIQTHMIIIKSKYMTPITNILFNRIFRFHNIYYQYKTKLLIEAKYRDLRDNEKNRKKRDILKQKYKKTKDEILNLSISMNRDIRLKKYIEIGEIYMSHGQDPSNASFVRNITKNIFESLPRCRSLANLPIIY